MSDEERSLLQGTSHMELPDDVAKLKFDKHEEDYSVHALVEERSTLVNYKATLERHLENVEKAIEDLDSAIEEKQ